MTFVYNKMFRQTNTAVQDNTGHPARPTGPPRHGTSHRHHPAIHAYLISGAVALTCDNTADLTSRPSTHRHTDLGHISPLMTSSPAVSHPAPPVIHQTVTISTCVTLTSLSPPPHTHTSRPSAPPPPPPSPPFRSAVQSRPHTTPLPPRPLSPATPLHTRGTATGRGRGRGWSIDPGRRRQYSTRSKYYPTVVNSERRPPFRAEAGTPIKTAAQALNQPHRATLTRLASHNAAFTVLERRTGEGYGGQVGGDGLSGDGG